MREKLSGKEHLIYVSAKTYFLKEHSTHYIVINHTLCLLLVSCPPNPPLLVLSHQCHEPWLYLIISTLCFLLVSYPLIHSSTFLPMPWAWSLLNSLLWGTLSKALLMSKKNILYLLINGVIGVRGIIQFILSYLKVVISSHKQHFPI